MSDLVDAIQAVLEDKQGNVNTTMPGTIISYDAATNRAVVAISMPKHLANDETLPSPIVHDVPVIMATSGMNGKQAAITLPIGPGDGVMLSFAQRSIDEWLEGKNDAPDDPRQFDINDCIATPGLNAAGVAGNATDLVIRMGESSITLTPSGNIIIKAESIIIEAGGKRFPLELHVHENTQPQPGGISGVPLG